MESDSTPRRTRRLSSREAVNLLVNFAEAYSVAQVHGPGTEADVELLKLTERLLQKLTGKEPSADAVSTVFPY